MNIRDERIKINMTQKELASLCGLSQAMISFAEAGRTLKLPEQKKIEEILVRQGNLKGSTEKVEKRKGGRAILVNSIDYFQGAKVVEKDKSNLEEGVRVMVRGLADYDSLVNRLLKTPRNRFSKEQLEAMPVEDLEKIVSIAEGGYSRGSYKKKEGVPPMPVAKWNKDGSPDFSDLD